MAVGQQTLLDYSQLEPLQKSERLVEAARAEGRQTAFLCHSHKDAKMAKGVQAWLRKQGWEVYIDWDDGSMPDRPSKLTAENIKRKIRTLDWLLFLATENSMVSRWCPWEIGYADGKKGADKVIILPTAKGSTTFGSEYLDLYRNIDSTQTGFAIFDAGDTKNGAVLSSIRR